jgi:hypothetical protein
VNTLIRSNKNLWGIESGMVDQSRVTLQQGNATNTKMHATRRRHKLAPDSYSEGGSEVRNVIVTGILLVRLLNLTFYMDIADVDFITARLMFPYFPFG